ncbi:MAG: protein kinase [Rubrivivax sp.]|nr:protein kinase [Rubrivivax sp.]
MSNPQIPILPAAQGTPAEPDAEATRILTSTEEEMARHLATQMAASQAEHQAREAAARQAAELADTEGLTAIPISPQRAAELAAQAAAAATLVQRPPTPPAAGAAQRLAESTDTRFPSTQFSPPTRAAAPDTPTAAGSPTLMTPPHGSSTLPGRSGGNENTTLPHGGLGTMAEGQMRQVGRYQVKSRLGRGGMATVYRAHDPSIGRDVAIKFLHASLCEDEDCRMRFLREARAAGGLSHPNIVVVHDVGEIERRPYMAMELIDGSPLSDKLEKTRCLPVREVVIIGLQLARALEYAHARGIVHRDIKPGNIMILADGQTIKVADFGIAHMDDGSTEQRTVVGAVMGTPQYMSPEQTRGDKVDGRSDLFSAGIVLYQLLAGERPFRGESLVAVATKIATEDPPPLNQKRPEVPASLRRVIDRCLAKKPEQRYQTGKEVAEALQKVLQEVDEAARESNKPRIVPLRVKWALTMALIVAVVMGLTTAVITQRQYAAMMGQVTDYGASLARFIAAQNAAAVLGDDWDAVDVLVQEMMKTRNFERVSVVDMAGVVKVSSLPALVGQPYKAEATQTSVTSGNGAALKRYSAQGEDILGFEAPVLFQGKQVGRVELGIPERPLTQVARLSITLMVVLAVVTVLAVAIAMYFVANWFAKPIHLLGESMAEIGKGRFDHRIGERRNDEFGLLFQAFDEMALALQRRIHGGAPAAPPTLPSTTMAAKPVQEQPTADAGRTPT